MGLATLGFRPGVGGCLAPAGKAERRGEKRILIREGSFDVRRRREYKFPGFEVFFHKVIFFPQGLEILQRHKAK